MSTFDTINENVASFVIEQIEEHFVPVTDEHLAQWPLDSRAIPGEMFISEEALIVQKRHVNRLDYYGGFEYVDKEYRAELGEYVMFSTECERVKEVVDAMLGVEEQLSEDEEF